MSTEAGEVQSGILAFPRGLEAAPLHRNSDDDDGIAVVGRLECSLDP